MHRDSSVLRFRPSQVASAALMFAINIIDDRVKNKAVPMIALKLQTAGLLVTSNGGGDIFDYVNLWTSKIK